MDDNTIVRIGVIGARSREVLSEIGEKWEPNMPVIVLPNDNEKKDFR